MYRITSINCTNSNTKNDSSNDQNNENDDTQNQHRNQLFDKKQKEEINMIQNTDQNISKTIVYFVDPSNRTKKLLSF